MTGEATLIRTREFYEENPRWLTFNVILIVVMSIVGAFLVGPLGIAIGILVGLASFFLIPPGRIKVRERTER